MAKLHKIIKYLKEIEILIMCEVAAKIIDINRFSRDIMKGLRE